MATFSPFIQYFKDKHEEFSGYPYAVQWGKDNKIMKELSRYYDAKTITRLIDQFFINMDTDDFLKQTGASIGIFRTQLPKLLLEMSNDDGKQEVGEW